MKEKKEFVASRPSFKIRLKEVFQTERNGKGRNLGTSEKRKKEKQKKEQKYGYIQ